MKKETLTNPPSNIIVKTEILSEEKNLLKQNTLRISTQRSYYDIKQVILK